MVRKVGLEPTPSSLRQLLYQLSYFRIFLRLGGATPPAHISLFTQESRDRFYRQPIRESSRLPTPNLAGYLQTSNAVPHIRFTTTNRQVVQGLHPFPVCFDKIIFLYSFETISLSVRVPLSFTSILYHILIYLSSVF